MCWYLNKENSRKQHAQFAFCLQINWIGGVMRGLKRMTTFDHSIYMWLVDQIGKWSIFRQFYRSIMSTLTSYSHIPSLCLSYPSPTLQTNIFFKRYAYGTEFRTLFLPFYNMIFGNHHFMHKKIGNSRRIHDAKVVYRLYSVGYGFPFVRIKNKMSSNIVSNRRERKRL